MFGFVSTLGINTGLNLGQTCASQAFLLPQALSLLICRIFLSFFPNPRTFLAAPARDIPGNVSGFSYHWAFPYILSMVSLMFCQQPSHPGCWNPEHLGETRENSSEKRSVWANQCLAFPGKALPVRLCSVRRGCAMSLVCANKFWECLEPITEECEV